MKTNVIIRADGSTATGMGHVVRSLALAAMLKNDLSIRFAIQQPDAAVLEKIHALTRDVITLPVTSDYAQDAQQFVTAVNAGDIVVLDGYHFDTAYQQAIRNKGAKLVCIDDLHAWHQLADVIINHADGVDASAYSTEPYTKLCLGLRYALLRPPFLQSSGTKKIKALSKIFISMGAADVHNLSLRFAEALVQMQSVKAIHLMIGAVNPHRQAIEAFMQQHSNVEIELHIDISAEQLAALLRECDAVICPASSISLEACAIGTGLVSGYTAENQLGILEGLQKHNTVINIGDMRTLSVETIREHMEAIAAVPEQLNDLIAAQSEMIDGRSPERLRAVFNALAAEKLRFRFAGEADTDLYFKWANDPLVRQNSFNQQAVIYEDHVSWFRKRLQSPTTFFYLFLNTANEPVGQVRIEKGADKTVIGISIDEAARGQSLAVEMLRKASQDYLQKHPGDVIAAYIKTENAASYNSFKKAGFGEESLTEVNGYKSYKLYKRREQE